MTVADEEKSLPKRLAIFQRTRELSKRDFYIYYQKSLLQGGVIWEFAEISTWIS